MTRTFKSGAFQHAGDPAALDLVLRDHFGQASWGSVRKLIETGKVSVDGTRIVQTRYQVAPGSTVTLSMAAPKPRAGLAHGDDLVAHVDRHLIVVRKPPGLATVRREGEATHLEGVVQRWLARTEKKRARVFVVHRLDKVTSGLLVFARSEGIMRGLKDQFREHSTERQYVAIAHGRVPGGTLAFNLVRDRGDGMRGVTDNPERGQVSVTHVETVEALPACSRVHCRLETGRTHQIRIHLSHIGHPIVGDPVYTKDYRGRLLESPRTLLHAASLGFTHPVTGERMTFEQELPAIFGQFMAKHRAGGGAR